MPSNQSSGQAIDRPLIQAHERPLAERFANRIGVLSDGRLVSDTFRRAEAQRLHGEQLGESFGANS